MAMGLVDDIVPVSGSEALHLARELARREGILAGTSGGATLAGALRVCASARDGATVLCMLPDTGERYLSTPLFENIPATMTEEERTIAASTPSCRFDAPAPSPGEVKPEPVQVDDVAAAFVAAAIGDAKQPVVMFALEWCEFCWSVRKMFAGYGIPYRSVDLDSVEYQANDFGGKIRAAVSQRTGFKTIPQIFVGGEFVGGCTDLFDAYRAGALQQRLAANGVTLKQNPTAPSDPYQFLPGWLHPR
jgi:cysteine synthase A